MSRWAAKPIISRKRSASGVFSTSARRFIISSVIDGSSNQVGGSQPDPYRRIIDDHPPSRPPATALPEGARAGGFATADLHHHQGRDPIELADDPLDLLGCLH